MKKILSLSLALVLVLSLFAVAGVAEGDKAFQKFDNVVEVHIGMSVDPSNTTLPSTDKPDDNYFTRYLLENYNIKVVADWTAAGGDDYNQKIALCIASNSMPDAIVAGDRAHYLAAAENDMLFDIGAIFDEYSSSQVKDIMAATNGRGREWVTYAGKMLAMPAIVAVADSYTVMMIQKNWLDDLKLEVPKNLDELYAVAKAIKEAAPAGAGTIPVLGMDSKGRLNKFFNNSSNGNTFDPIFQAMGAFPGYFVLDADKKVTYGSLSAETRATLELLAKWYKEGLIDPELGTRDDSSVPFSSNTCGIVFAPWWKIGYGSGASFKNDANVNWQSYPLYNANGEWHVTGNPVGGQYIMVRKGVSDDVAKAIVIMNNVLVRDEAKLDQETDLDIEWWPLRCVMAPMDEVERTYEEIIKILDGEKQPEDYKDAGMYKHLYKDASSAKDLIPGYKKGEPLNRADFNMADDSYQRLYSIMIGDRPAATGLDKAIITDSVTYASNEEITRYWANLETLERSLFPSIITGKSDISEFDKFVEQWKTEGGSKILEAVQKEYDASK